MFHISRYFTNKEIIKQDSPDRWWKFLAEGQEPPGHTYELYQQCWASVKVLSPRPPDESLSHPSHEYVSKVPQGGWYLTSLLETLGPDLVALESSHGPETYFSSSSLV